MVVRWIGVCRAVLVHTSPAPPLSPESALRPVSLSPLLSLTAALLSEESLLTWCCHPATLVASAPTNSPSVGPVLLVRGTSHPL